MMNQEYKIIEHYLELLPCEEELEWNKPMPVRKPISEDDEVLK